MHECTVTFFHGQLHYFVLFTWMRTWEREAYCFLTFQFLVCLFVHSFNLPFIVGTQKMQPANWKCTWIFGAKHFQTAWMSMTCDCDFDMGTGFHFCVFLLKQQPPSTLTQNWFIGYVCELPFVWYYLTFKLMLLAFSSYILI